MADTEPGVRAETVAGTGAGAVDVDGVEPMAGAGDIQSPILLGIRHHGPGSARAVRRALSAYQPDVVLIEGPPEAEPLLDLAGDDAMRAPVALLAYPGASNRDTDPRATFWPFGEFSPEWQALRWAAACDVPVQLIDLPAAAMLAADAHRPAGRAAGSGEVRADPIAALAAAAGYDDPERWWEDVVEHRADRPMRSGPGWEWDRSLFPPNPSPTPPSVSEPEPVRLDRPESVGFGGSEPVGFGGSEPVRLDRPEPDRLGPDGPDQREDDELAAALAPFAAIAEAMAEVRAAHPPAEGSAEGLLEERREATMRTRLRAALRAYRRVAVVCGAWHVPALTAPMPTATTDARLLRGLPKVKVAMTWVPWTHARLASGQGYGAGVRSPGWYHHLFTTPPAEAVPRWLVRAARVLRRDGLPVSSAHVIEATRLAETLATLRGRPVPGLTEVTDAALAVLCEGDVLRLELIQRRLVVGERLGAVPDRAPSVPIARDVAAAQRRLRLPPRPEPREIDLDLRREFDLERSRLLHRLGLLGVDWGVALTRRSGRGTFWESWQVAWQPEFAVDLVEASAYGTTVRDAASARVAEQAAAARSLADVTSLVERCLLAELPDGLPPVLAALDERMARVHDLAQLMAALPALARTLRYGDVRHTDLTALRQVTERLVTRICVGLPAAVAGLDDAAAAAMRDRVDAVDAAVALLDDGAGGAADQVRPETPGRHVVGGRAECAQVTGQVQGAGRLTARWRDVLVTLSTRDDIHGLLAGRFNRLLLDAGRLDAGEAGRRMAVVLTAGVPAGRAAAWIEGFLTGDGLLLVHDERLLRLVDDWLTGIPPDAFVEVLPLLRRTFSEYPAPQRRQIGERAVRLGEAESGRGAAFDDDLDTERAALVMPTVELLLGGSRS